MMRLTAEQIQFVSKDIYKRGVRSKILHDDMLDHICCLIESGSSTESNFAKVYNDSLKKCEPLAYLNRETNNAIVVEGIFHSVANVLMTLLYLSLALLFVGFPLTFSIYKRDILFIILFFPAIIAGLYILITRINYKKFTIIPFTQKMFGHSLIH